MSVIHNPKYVSSLLFGLGLVVAVAVTLRMNEANNAELQTTFEDMNARVTDQLKGRIQAYEYGLRGARGAIIAAGGLSITRERFRHYADSRNLSREFPGALGFSFIQRVKQADEASFLLSARKELRPDFKIRQLTSHEGDRFVLKYTEPEVDGSKAIGLDLASDPSRRQALLSAMQSGKATLTSPLTLLRADQKTALGFWMVLPVYRVGTPLATPEARARANLGWVNAPFLIDETIKGLDLHRGQIAFSLKDTTEAARFYASAGYDRISTKHLEKQTQLNNYGRSWQLDVKAQPAFFAAHSQYDAPLSGGIIAALAALFSGFLYFLLRNRQARLTAEIINAMPDAMLVCDSNGLIIRSNIQLESIFGYGKNELIGQSVDILLPEHFRVQHIVLRATYDTNQTRMMGMGRELNGLRKDGSEFPVEIALGSVSVDGKTHVIAALTDITERKRTSEDLELYRLMIENSGDPIFLIDDDDNCRMSYVNEAAVKHFGAPREEILTWHIPDWDPNFSYETLAEHVTEVKQIKNLFIETVHRVKGGGLIPVEISLNLVPYKGGTCHFGYFKNISHRKREEQSLIESRKVLAQIAAGLPLDDIFASVLALVEFNAMTGIGSIHLVDTENHRLYHGVAPNLPEEYNALIDDIEYADGIGSCGTAAATGREVIAEDLATHPYWTNYREATRAAGLRACWSVPAINEAGEVVATMAVYYREPRLPTEYELNQVRLAANFLAIAIARQKKEDDLVLSKERAETASLAKSDFVANMSHEIRTPMNAVLGMAHLLKDTKLDTRQKTYLRNIEGASNILLGVINDILDYSKIEAGKLELENSLFDLGDVLNSLATIAVTASKSKNIDVLFQIDADVPRDLIGDPLRLGQVLINLTNNAIKFTQQGEVIVRVAVASVCDWDARLVFSVQDTGIGMTDEQLKNLFQTFSQADASTSRRFGGTGLGLAISRRLTELMDSQLEVGSEYGKGSRFQFAVTLRKQNRENTSWVTVPDNLRYLKVLIVDDNSAARMTSYEAVQSFGWTGVAVDSCAKAIERLEEAGAKSFDLLLLGVCQSYDDCLAVARKIKALQIAQQPKILLLTNAFNEALGLQFEANMVEGTLTKPFTPSSFLDAAAVLFVREQMSASASPPSAELRAHFPSLRILVAEDNDLNQFLIAELLRQLEVSVTLVGNGAECLTRLKTEASQYDLVLMDMQMPEMDGLEATRRIRGDLKLTEMPIIALTANAMAVDQQRCLDAGMNDFLAKPIDPDRLSNVLQRFAHEGASHRNVVMPQADEGGLNLSLWPSMDTQSAIKRMGGDEALYIEILIGFLESQSDFGINFRACLNDEGRDSECAIRVAHTLGGLAATIGAEQLAQQVWALEQCVKDEGSSAACIGQLVQVEALLSPLFVEIELIKAQSS